MRWHDRWRAEAMDKLSNEGRSVYSLLRVDFTADLDQRFKGHNENLLQAIDKLIQANNTRLDGLLTTHVDEVWADLVLELKAVRRDWPRESPGRGETLPPRLVGGARNSAADSLGLDQDHRGKAHALASNSNRRQQRRPPGTPEMHLRQRQNHDRNPGHEEGLSMGVGGRDQQILP
ncbi:hypothetical protein ZWY2020_047937 [Hordeum vulgare]|nr:hypothetical protein ZWY2020_047937 [Hordeum vulgare]